MSKDLFYRSMGLDIVGRADGDDMSNVPITIATGTRVRRWFGDEVLSMKKGAVNLKSASAVLFNHHPDKIVGPLTGKKSDGDAVRGVLNFDETDEGQTAKLRVASGSLSGVSAGYIVHKFRRLGSEEKYKDGNGRIIEGTPDDNPTYVATEWELKEASLTPIPADVNSAIGRCASRSLDGIEIEADEPDPTNTPASEGDRTATHTGGSDEMKDKDAKTGDAVVAPEPVDEAKVRRAVMDAMTSDMKTVFARAAAARQTELAFRLMSEGKTVDEITDALFAAVSESRGQASDAGERKETSTSTELSDISDVAFARVFTGEISKIVLD